MLRSTKFVKSEHTFLNKKKAIWFLALDVLDAQASLLIKWIHNGVHTSPYNGLLWIVTVLDESDRSALLGRSTDSITGSITELLEQGNSIRVRLRDSQEIGLMRSVNCDNENRFVAQLNRVTLK